MKGIDFLRALSGIDGDLIARAAPLEKPGRGAATIWRRWAKPLAACLAVAIAVALPLMLGARYSHPPAEVVLPGTPGSTGDYTLHFNQAREQAADRIYLPMMFAQKLTADEIMAVFPDLHRVRTIAAAASFFYHDSSFARITAHISSAAGLNTTVLITRDQVFPDYVIEGNPETSDVMGIPVTAAYVVSAPDSKGEKNIIFLADFQIDGIGYHLILDGGTSLEKEMRQELTEIIGLLISGGAADISILNPSRPEGWRRDQLSLEEARTDDTFGQFIPASLPEGYLFENAYRTIDQSGNELSAYWRKGMGDLRWRIAFFGEEGQARLTSTAATKNYDLSLYPIPWADSVPSELREIVENPVFKIEELTLEVVKRRALEISDAGDEPGTRLRFSVLYGDVVVEVVSKGVPAEKIYEALLSIG